MIYLVGLSLVLLASAAMAQQVLPGTLASTATPESVSESGSASSSSDARPFISGQERIRWAVRGTLGPGALLSAGWGTLLDFPKAYGTHWEGFGQRYGMRVSANGVSNTMEAGLGAIWGEDPRYVRDAGASFGHRIGHAVKMTFMAEDRAGNLRPAYARLIAIPGSSFLSNTWRTDSDATPGRASVRTGFRFLDRLGSNTLAEFWPDVRQKLFHRQRYQAHN